jgi:hypothetical protein
MTRNLRRIAGVALIAAEDLLGRSLTTNDEATIDQAVHEDTLVDTLVDLSLAGSPVELPDELRDELTVAVTEHLNRYEWS